MKTCLLILWLLSTGLAFAQTLTRGMVIETARAYAEMPWRGTAANVRRGADSAGILVQTPSVPQHLRERAPEGFWIEEETSLGMPYEWGGFDTPTSFRKGIAAGAAAGDLYTLSKRQGGDLKVSADAVGVDCSGFISRCWKLPTKYGTATLPKLCQGLASPQQLKPGDIMNTPAGHVLLFAEWVDDARTQARFFEADPGSKVRIGEYSVPELIELGFKPWRYRKLRD